LGAKLKVLHVYRTYYPDTQGGGQEVIRQICESTKAFDVESRVFTPSEDPRPKEVMVDDHKVVRVKLNFEIASCGFCLTGFGEFRSQVAWADVIHYHFPWPFADVMHFSQRVQKPTVITYHSDIVRQQSVMRFYSPLMRRFLSSMDRIVATSSNYRDSSEVLCQFQHNVDVVPIGIDEASYPSVDQSILKSTKEKYGEGFFLFVGVLRYYKGLHILLEASQNADFKVVIAGFGPLEAALKRQALDLNLANVTFAGKVTDEEKVVLLTLCRGVVFSSHVRSEAFGVSLIEGAMFGKPLVSAETGTGTSYVNQHKETGLVVEANDVAALSEALTYLHENESEAWQLGQGARKRYDNLFTGKRMAQGYVNIYQSLVDTEPSQVAETS
jgi:rhamnosyl/mannosyltransferase|tara:strand:+ start:3303 stop:4454 length:1152 start_codon:yes stop_codon:yes gene_type:complete